jgi:hypothetical protein
MRINFDDFNKGVRTAFDQRMRVQRVRKLRNIFRASSSPKPAQACPRGRGTDGCQKVVGEGVASEGGAGLSEPLCAMSKLQGGGRLIDTHFGLSRAVTFALCPLFGV